MKEHVSQPLRRFLILVLTLALLLLSMPQLVLAAGGAYSINFAAADPKRYEKLTPADRPAIAGGRASSPIPGAEFGVPNVSVESLMPKDLLLGMVVPFLFRINVNGSTAPESGAIEFTAYWLTKTTSGDNFGFDPAYRIYSAFVDTGDPATKDPGGNATVAHVTSAILNGGTANEQIEGTFRIEGLDDGDTAIVEVWLVLKDSTDPKVSGNVHTGLRSAVTVSAAPEVISTGTQTVPLLQSGSFYTAKANLTVSKADAPDPVWAGENVTYTITVTNNPPGGTSEHAVANGIMVTDLLDPISTFVSATVSQGTYIRSGQTITWDVGGLAQNLSATMTVTVTAPAVFTNYDTSLNAEPGGAGSATKGAGPPARDMVNNVSGTMITADTNSSDDAWFQPTNILYKAAGSVALAADKVLTGRTLKAGEFSFQLKQGASVLQTKTNAANGAIAFDAIHYTEADIGKTYSYTIVEVPGSLAGVTYDPLVISVSVLVTDNGDGTLSATPTYSADTTFNNTYSASGSAALAASKALSGRPLVAGAFSFQLKEGAALLQTRTNAADGAIAFDAIPYTLADVGVHTYTITEVNAGAAGYTYDAMVLTVTVTVTDSGNGTLSVVPSYPADTTFNNSYAASGSVTLAATKVLTGRTLGAGEFSFQLKEGATLQQTRTNAAGGAIAFDPINYTLANVGLHTYTITEVAGSLGGVTYDPMTLTVTVTVTDNGDGTLSATPAYPADTTFNNTYAASGSVTLAATKVLTGRTLGAGEFSFQLKEGATLLQTRTNAAGGAIAFDPINYTLANVGLHTYTITEAAGSLGGVTYDPMVLTVTVTVTDNGNGTLTATPDYPADTVFNNSYAASGSVTLSASKSLTGRTLAAGEFSFQLKEGATLLQTRTNAAGGSITFDTIPYTLANVGSHTYTITEVPGSLGGVTYDPLVITITVNVTDNGNGTLNAVPIYPADTVFNNSYTASGNVTLAVSKILTGRVLAAGEFSFQLKEGATLLQTRTNAANGSITFDAITYTLANVGTHTYAITEVNAGAPGYTYDPLVLTVTVNVTDNGDGTLTATPAYPADTTFNNSYAASGSVSLTATKVLTGRALAAGEFSFQLKEGATLLQTKTNAANGSITFDAISYTLASVGVHTYTITEGHGSLGGVTYDPLVITVTVTVSDNGDGTLTATPAYPADTTFNNSYAASGSVALAATKVLTGRALAAGEFSFQLREGAALLQTRTNAAGGAISFSAISYTLADVGVHTYTITEAAGGLGGVTYDPMTLTVTVTVTDNGDGTLTATPAYPADTTFNNTYAASGSVTLAATKSLTGRSLAAGEFAFQLKEGATLLQTRTNAANGSIAFDAISYTLADVGSHTYTITEAAGSLGGVTYDPLVINVTVTVIDNGNGTLTATPAYPADVTFNNTYNASGSITLAASKVLTGRALAAGEFAFELKEVLPGGPALLQTRTNAADGSIAFDAIPYTLANVGSHIYTITEVAGSLGGMTYDPMALTVTVTVTDNGDGTLTATPAYPADTTFNNTYSASGSVSLAATKSLVGRTLAAGEFAFELKEVLPGGPALLQTRTNAADGSITFDTIPYTLADVGLHTYTITEAAGILGGIGYDPLVITVSVLVADNGDGTLTAMPLYSADVTFDNIYEAAGSVTLAATKSLFGRTLAAGEFSFQLKEEDIHLQTATNAADGAITFSPIDYTLADLGIHTYTITEAVGTEASMHYDPLAVTVTVTVSDSGDGTLTATPAYPEDTTFNNEYLTPAITIVKTVANQTAGDPFGKFASFVDTEIAAYRIVVTNTGNTVLENVTVTDDQAAAGTVATLSTGGTATFTAAGGGLSAISLGTLQPGASVTLDYTYLVRYADIARAPITNTATVTGTMPPTRAFPEGQTLTASDDAVIDVGAIALADIGLDIIKMVRNKTVNGILAKLATGYAGDVFEFEVTVSNPALQAPLSDVKLYDSQARVGSKVTRVSDNAELTWADDGTGHAVLNIGYLATQTSVTYRYSYTATKEDEETVIGNIALAKGIFKPEREGYADVPIEAQDDAAIGVLAPPPTTGEAGGQGTLLGIALLLVAMAALAFSRKLRRTGR